MKTYKVTIGYLLQGEREWKAFDDDITAENEQDLKQKAKEAAANHAGVPTHEVRKILVTIWN